MELLTGIVEMEGLFLISIVFFLVVLVFTYLIKTRITPSPKLPPGPTPLPFVGNLLLIRKHSSSFTSFLENLHSKYGPIITLHVGSRPLVFISSNTLAHRALVQNGAVFADRPPPATTSKVLYTGSVTIFSASYGPNWSLLRRNLISQLLHPSRLKSFSGGRLWVMQRLISSLKAHSVSGLGSVQLLDHVVQAMVSLSVFMCFGLKLDDEKIRETAELLHRVLLSASRHNKLNFYPERLGKIMLPRLWKDLLQLRKDKEVALLPLMRARYEGRNDRDNEILFPYLDTLSDLHLPEENRKLEEGEIISLCSELLNGVVHTTVVAMQWTMANIVKYPEIQLKLYSEMSRVIGKKGAIEEDDLKKMAYLKAVILESLRRHPTGHFSLPHAVTEPVWLDGYIVPKNASVNFNSSQMNWDSKLWEAPMEFKPERFLDTENEISEEVLDITGSKEIKMMPFGAGRRICPGIGLTMLHLQLFVANLVWHFEWRAVDEVDLTEKMEVTLTMKNPLKAEIRARSDNLNE